MNSLYDELRIALHGIWTRRWLALGVAWGVCLLGWLVVSMIPNRYESQARVQVQMQSVLQERLGVTPAERQRQIDRIRQTLTASVNLEKVVRGTDLNQTIASDGDVAARVAMLQKDIKVVAQQDNLFEITAGVGMGGNSDAANARLARAVVQTLIDVFIEDNLAGGRAENSQTLKFLDAQLAQRQQQLQDAEQKKLAFENQFMGLLPGVGSVGQRMEAARAELSQVDSQLVAAQSSLSAVNAQMTGLAPSISTPGMAGGAGPAAARLAVLQSQLADARLRGFTDAHPDVVAIQNQIGGARAAAVGEGRTGGTIASGSPNPLYISLRSMQAEKQAAVAALSSRKNQLQGDMNELIAKQTSDPGAAAEQGRLARDQEVLRTQYEKLLTDREQIALRGQVESETDAMTFRVIDPPSAPRVPAAPNRPMLLALVLVAGLGAGVGAAFAKGQLKTSYPTAQRLEKASGLPVIGAIGEVLDSAARALSRKRLIWFASGSAGLAGAFALLMLVEFVQRGMVA